jgi:hypothetical protein
VEPRPYPPDLTRPPDLTPTLEPGFVEAVLPIPRGVLIILGELAIVTLVGGFALAVVGRRYFA